MKNWILQLDIQPNIELNFKSVYLNNVVPSDVWFKFLICFTFLILNLCVINYERF